jgi:hypothetical protein
MVTKMSFHGIIDAANDPARELATNVEGTSAT